MKMCELPSSHSSASLVQCEYFFSRLSEMQANHIPHQMSSVSISEGGWALFALQAAISSRHPRNHTRLVLLPLLVGDAGSFALVPAIPRPFYRYSNVCPEILEAYLSICSGDGGSGITCIPETAVNSVARMFCSADSA